MGKRKSGRYCFSIIIWAFGHWISCILTPRYLLYRLNEKKLVCCIFEPSDRNGRWVFNISIPYQFCQDWCHLQKYSSLVCFCLFYFVLWNLLEQYASLMHLVSRKERPVLWPMDDWNRESFAVNTARPLIEPSCKRNEEKRIHTGPINTEMYRITFYLRMLERAWRHCELEIPDMLQSGI